MRQYRLLVLLWATLIILVAQSASADSITFEGVVTQIKSDFELFYALQEQFLIHYPKPGNYPAPGHYFQGIASPGVYNEPTQRSLIYIPVDGIPRDFNPHLKPSHRSQDWSDFGFIGDANGQVIAQYEIWEFVGPRGEGYILFSRFGWQGSYYQVAGGIADEPGLPRLPVGVYQISGSYNYAVPEPSTILLLGSGLLGFVGLRKRFKK